MKVKKRFTRKKKFLIAAAALLLIIALGVTFLFACSNTGADGKSAAPAESKSICLTPPDDGSLPTDHTGLENVGYIIGRLLSREAYHTENVSTAKASALFGAVNVTQNVVGSKDYKDGILITSSISTSTSSFAPSKAIQRFYGAETAVVRTAASSKASDWNGLQTEWSQEAPSEILDKEQHEGRYGLWATEFSDYVINEETCLSFGEIASEGDAYSLTIELEPNESTYYYKNQMKTMGDLDECPVFSSVRLTMHFTADWTITSMDIAETYSSKKGFTADCEGNAVITYYYDESKVDVSAYETYFVNYADAATTGAGEQEMTASDYLSKGFASVLGGESRFAVQAEADGNAFAGNVLLDMSGGSLNKLQAEIGSLRVLYEGGALYAQYKDFLGKLALDGEESPIGELNFDIASLQEGLECGEPVKDGQNVTVACSFPFGDTELPLVFGFTETAEKDVSLSYIEVTLDVFGTEVFLRVEPAENGGEFAEIDTAAAVDLKPYIEDIYGLFVSGRYALSVSYGGEAFAVKGNIAAETEPFALYGELEISADASLFGGAEGEILRLPVTVSVLDGEVWLKAGNIAVKTSLSELEEGLNEIFALAGAGLPESFSADAKEIVFGLLRLDFDKIVKKLALSETSLELIVDGDALLDGLSGIIGQQDIAVGDVKASYDAQEKCFAVDILGVSLTLAGGTQPIEAPDDAEYIQLDLASLVLQAYETVQNAMNGETQFSLALLIGENTLKADALLKMNGGQFESLQIRSGELAAFTDGEALFVRCYGFLGKIALSEVSAMLSGIGAGSPVDLTQIINSLLAATLEREQDLYAFECELALGDISLPIRFAFTQSNGETEIEYVRCTFDMFGTDAEATLSLGGDGAFETFETAGAVDLKPYVQGIADLAASRKYTVALSYGDTADGLSVQGTLRVDASEDLALAAKLQIVYDQISVPVEITAETAGSDNPSVYIKIGESLRVRTTLEDLTAALDKMTGGISVQGGAPFGLSDIVSALFEIDYGALIGSLTATQNGISAVLNGDALLPALSALLNADLSGFGIGTIRAQFDGSAFALDVFGVSLCLRGGIDSEIAVPSDGEYVSVSVADLVDFAGPIEEIVSGKQIDFSLRAQLSAEGIGSQSLLLEGRIRFDGPLQMYLAITLGGFEAEILYADGSVQIGCGGYNFRLTKDDLQVLTEEIDKLLAEKGMDESGAALKISDIADALLRSVSAAESQELGGISLIMDLAKLFGQEVGDRLALDISLTDEGAISVQGSKLAVNGVEIGPFDLEVKAGKSVPGSLAGETCDNLFEFIFSAYIGATSEDEIGTLGIAVEYASAELSAEVDGRLELIKGEKPAEGSAAVDLNFDIDAKIDTYDAAGVVSASHYISATLYGDTLYLAYSTKGFPGTEGTSPLRISVPVIDLFAMGETVLPLLAPFLGIDLTKPETVPYYYTFVQEILGGYADADESVSGIYRKISSDTFAMKDFGEWIRLIFGIIDEYSGTVPAEESAQKATDPFGFTAENGAIKITAGAVKVEISAQTEEGRQPIGAPEDASSYWDGSSLARLLQDVLQAYDYADPSHGYRLTDSVNIEVIGVELDLAVNIDLRVGVNEDGSVEIALRLTTPQYFNVLGGLMGSSVIINGNTVTDISIADGYVSMARTQTTYYYTGWDFWNIGFRDLSTPYVDCRAMTLDAFFADIMNQIFFAINLSDGMQNFIRDQAGLNDPDNNQQPATSSTNYDAGEMLTSYSGDEAGYHISMNLAAVTGMDEFGETALDIYRTQNGDHYDLTSLEGSVTLVKVVTLKLKLTHRDPGTDAQAQKYCAENVQSVAEAFGYADGAALYGAVAASSSYLSISNH